VGYSNKDLKDDIGDVIMCPEGTNFLKATSNKVQLLVQTGMEMATMLATATERCTCMDEPTVVVPGAPEPKACRACIDAKKIVVAFATLINNPLKQGGKE